MKLIYSIIFLLFITGHAFAGEVYKYTDANGKVIYSNKKPNNTEVETLNIQQSNSINTQSKNNKAKEQFFRQQRADEQRQQYRKAEAKKRQQAAQKKAASKTKLSVKQAQKLLEEAKTIQSGDMFPLPNGGSRYSEQYQNRIKEAEQALEEAKKAN